jgi:hypothetical protein
MRSCFPPFPLPAFHITIKFIFFLSYTFETFSSFRPATMSKTPLLATASGTYQATSEEGSSIRIGDFKNGMQKIQQHIHNASSCGICKNDIGKACLVCQQLTQASGSNFCLGFAWLTLSWFL